MAGARSSTDDLPACTGTPALHADPLEPGGLPLRRVGLLIGQLGLGDTEKQVVLLARGLRERGIDVGVLVMFAGGPREAAPHAAGVPVVQLGFVPGVGPRAALANLAAFARLVRHLRRYRPDVLHAFLFHSYVTAAPAARIARLGVLVASRRSLGDFNEGRRPPLAVERLATRMTDLLVANAEAVAMDTFRNERVRAAKIVTIYNGLPDAAFAPAEPAAIDGAAPVVLCVAGLRAHKGHRYLLEAAALLRDRGVACTLALAGDGPERDALEKQAARLGVDVRFLGRRTDIGALLARARVVTLPSLHEGMSNAVMEAMAAGRPVVATDVGGTRELLHGRGVLVPPGDAEALAGGLAEVLGDPALAADLGVRARDWSLANLSADAMVDRHVHLYRDLLERRCAE